ncbi:MAG TPA: DUF3592 domain-containing protein [Polyangiaceae bacterium]
MIKTGADLSRVDDERARPYGFREEMGEVRTGKLFSVLGGCLLAVAVGLCLLTLDFIHHARSAEGLVSPASTSDTHARIDFATASGQKVWFGTGGEIATRPGQRVQVLYQEGLDPRWHSNGVDARLAAAGALWYLPSMLALLGGGLLVVGLCGSSIERMLRALRRASARPLT